MATFDPTISIVLATHNGEAFLEKQLASLAGQTKRPLELVISDDASGDRTREIIRKFERTAPFPVIVNLNDPGKGYRENFLSVTPLTRGDWIAFCDQDDIWYPAKLETCATYMSIPGITQIAHQADLIDASGEHVGLFDQGIRRTGVTRQLAYDVWQTFWGFSLLFDRRILEVVRSDQRFIDYIDARHLIAHDRWVFFLAQTLGHTVEIAEPLAGYRQHANNLFGNGAASARGKSTSDLRIENRTYLTATTQMREIVQQIPTGVEKVFPLFDRARALEVYGHAIRQLQGRERLYAGETWRSVIECFSMLLRGDYRNAQNSSIRWRSLARDLKAVLTVA